MTKKMLIPVAVAAVCVAAIPSVSQARSSYGFSISTGGPAFGPAYYAPAPVYVAPPPPVVYYPPPVYRPAYYRPAPAFSFSYYGR